MSAARKRERTTEAEVERDVLVALGRLPDVLICKNEVGTGMTGDLKHALRAALAPFGPIAVQAALAACTRHHITYGLGVGSPDLVGSVRSARGHAIPVGIELKAPDGVVQEHQERWHRAARLRGLHVSVVRSADEALAAVQRARAGELE